MLSFRHNLVLTTKDDSLMAFVASDMPQHLRDGLQKIFTTSLSMPLRDVQEDHSAPKLRALHFNYFARFCLNVSVFILLGHV